MGLMGVMGVMGVMGLMGLMGVRKKMGKIERLCGFKVMCKAASMNKAYCLKIGGSDGRPSQPKL